jgi:excisionase family DNA binding protein
MSALLSEEEVAKQLHVSVASLRRWRLERRGPRFIKVGSLVRYKPEELEAWLVALPTGGAGPSVNPSSAQRGEVTIVQRGGGNVAVQARKRLVV